MKEKGFAVQKSVQCPQFYSLIYSVGIGRAASMHVIVVFRPWTILQKSNIFWHVHMGSSGPFSRFSRMQERYSNTRDCVSAHDYHCYRSGCEKQIEFLINFKNPFSVHNYIIDNIAPFRERSYILSMIIYIRSIEKYSQQGLGHTAR